LEKRLSCNLLTREEMLGGKTPTTPTTSSVIAGIQVQEAVKLIHGLPVLAGKGFVFEGLHHSSYVTEYTENPDCMSHETFSSLIEFPGTSETTTLSDLYEFAAKHIDSDNLVIEFSRDVIQSLVCPRCHASEELFAPVGTVSRARGTCPADGVMREVVTIHNFSGKESFGQRKLSELGLPRFDVFVARNAVREVAILMSGDRTSILGPLAEFNSTVWPRVREQSEPKQASALAAQEEVTYA
jgi:adenylyltransferase/sulfurtransferase